MSTIALSHDTEALAYRPAQAEGVPVTVVIAKAITERARAAGITAQSGHRDLTPAGVARRHAAIRRLAAEISALPIQDSRSPTEIIDEFIVL